MAFSDLPFGDYGKEKDMYISQHSSLALDVASMQ